MEAQQNSAPDRSGSRAHVVTGDDVARHALTTTRAPAGKAAATVAAAKPLHRRDAAPCGRIRRRLWTEPAFRRLSAPPPNARTLLLRLLSGPEASPLPGVVLVREGALAEVLGWPVDDLRRCWRELELAGLAAGDWSAGLVWLPFALDDNHPASPNVVRSWRAHWAAVPDCALKLRVYAELEAFAKGLGEAFAKAFGEAFAKAFPEGFRDGANARYADDIEPPPAGPAPAADPAPASGSALAPAVQIQRREKKEEKKREHRTQSDAPGAPPSGVFKLTTPKAHTPRKALVPQALVDKAWAVWLPLWARLYSGTYRRSAVCAAALERVVLAAHDMALEEANRRQADGVPDDLVLEAVRAILVDYMQRTERFVAESKHPLRLALQNLHAVRAPWEGRKRPRLEAAPPPAEPALEGAAAAAYREQATAAFAGLRVVG
jgi:hypothetical protein